MSALRTDPFQREKHVYKNDDFSEIIKDAVRFFHGTPVHTMPPPEPFDGAGVYAIYCIARQGLYRKFGETINREEYAVPIYVGKAVPPGGRKNKTLSHNSFPALPLGKQLHVFSSLIRTSIGLQGQFALRCCSFPHGNKTVINAVHRYLLRRFHPVWNDFFQSCVTPEALERKWCLAHSIRFQSRADAFTKNALEKMMKVL